MTKLKWPGGVERTLAALSLSLFNFNIFEAQCWISFRVNFYARSYFPMAILTVLLAYYGMLKLARKYVRRRGIPLAPPTWVTFIFPKLKSDFNGSQYRPQFIALLIRSFLTFLSLAYTYLSYEAISIFDCVNMTGQYRLRDFVGVECYTPEWYKYVATAMLSILLYLIGIPVLQLWLLHWFDYGRRGGSKSVLGSQVMGYKEGYRWWDTAGLIWRLAVVLCVRLLVDYTTAQICVFVALLLIRIVAQRLCRPFESPIPDREEIWLISLTVGVLFCGLGFYIADDQTHVPDGVTEALVVLALILVSSLIICTAYYVWCVHREFKTYGEVIHQNLALAIPKLRDEHERKDDDDQDPDGYDPNSMNEEDIGELDLPVLHDDDSDGPDERRIGLLRSQDREVEMRPARPNSRLASNELSEQKSQADPQRSNRPSEADSLDDLGDVFGTSVTQHDPRNEREFNAVFRQYRNTPSESIRAPLLSSPEQRLLEDGHAL